MAAMTRTEIVGYINRRMGYVEKRQDEILAELGVAQTNLEGGIHLPGKQGTVKPWFLVSEIQNVLTVIGEDRIAVPAAFPSQHLGFLAEVENAALWILDPDALDPTDPWKELDKMDFDRMIQKWIGPGLPKAYATMGTYFRLRYIPDKAYNLKIITSNADLLLASGTSTNKWSTFAPILLGATAGLAVATSNRDSVAMGRFQADIDIQTLNLYNDTLAREHINRRYTMGGDD